MKHVCPCRHVIEFVRTVDISCHLYWIAQELLSNMLYVIFMLLVSFV